MLNGVNMKKRNEYVSRYLDALNLIWPCEMINLHALRMLILPRKREIMISGKDQIEYTK